jgi:hypothetical protein
MKKIFVILPLFGFLPVYCQISETFSDGNFSANPIWRADTSQWTISSDLRLQSRSMTAGDVFFICSEQQLSGPLEWRFNATLQFNPSSANYIDVFLISTDSNLNAAHNRGYFLRIGSTEDDICLYRKDSAGIVRLLDGTDGFLNSSSNHLTVIVTRDQRNEWNFSCRKETSSFTSLTSGYMIDSTYNHSSFFGISVRQSTSGFFGKHYFDDIFIRPLNRDSLPPRLLAFKVPTPHKIELLFDERIDPSNAVDTNNYLLTDFSLYPTRIMQDSSHGQMLFLELLNGLPERVILNLRVQNLRDRYGNHMMDTIVKLAYYKPLIHDVLITELMADPEPSAGMPAAEWLELHNPSDFSINLKDWTIRKPNSDPVKLPDIVLPSGGYVVLTSLSGKEKLAGFCQSVSVSGFPALTNEGDTLLLLSDSGKLIHAVAYSNDWHENALKADGGWSLEMKDFKQPCLEKANWTSSSGYYGGTPGMTNAATSINRDQTAPNIINAFCIDSLYIHLLFDESLDSLSATDNSRYLIDHNIGQPATVQVRAPFFKELILNTTNPIRKDTIYQVELKGTADCAGNAITKSRVSFTRFSDCQKGDLLINEILFNPIPAGYDYVELYNNSKKAIDLSKIMIANKDVTGRAANIVPLIGQPFALLPGEYVAVTAEKEMLFQSFIVKNPLSVIENKNLPSFPDDEGSVLIMNQQGIVLDELDYSDKWHFELINDTEGISLERVAASIPTNSASNWHSAARRGTPGYENSQSRQLGSFSGKVFVDSPIFSPDQDGWQDAAIIRYQFPSEGYVLSVAIYNMNGMPVRVLANNLLAGTAGMFQWNGLDDRGRGLRPGTYIVCCEYFNSRGEKEKIKKTLVLASAP